MRRKKSIFPKRALMAFSVLTISTIGLSSYFLLNKAIKQQTVVVVKTENKKAIYPVQYSDKHITQNAIVSDDRFRNIAFFNTDNLLANTVSSVKNTGVVGTTSPEKGTWLWTPVLDITPKYRSSIISGAKKEGIKNIYLSIDSYLDIYVMGDGKEKELRKKEFDQNIVDFINEAHKNGMTVDAECGWRNWAEKGNEYKAFAILQYTINFNKTHKEKFRGFQYDIEPYLLEAYQKDKTKVLKNFVSLINQTVTKLDKSDLELNVTIPEFYDGVDNETPVFSFAGKTGLTIDHLLSILDRRAGSKIIVMSYRNFAKGPNGSIDISVDEINKANLSKTKVIIAQETGDVLPEYITFYNKTKTYYRKQVFVLENAFIKDKSFGGTATHYVNALLEL